MNLSPQDSQIIAELAIAELVKRLQCPKRYWLLGSAICIFKTIAGFPAIDPTEELRILARLSSGIFTLDSQSKDFSVVTDLLSDYEIRTRWLNYVAANPRIDLQSAISTYQRQIETA